MGILLKDELNNPFAYNPLSVFLCRQPFCAFVLVIISSFDLGIHYFEVDFLELIDASNSFFKEIASKILLGYL
jgi:hypothetical protein